MIGFLIHAAAVALGLFLASRFVPGIAVDSTGTLVAAAVLLALVNAVVKPILTLLTLPLTILTLGLFLLVINAAMIGLVAVFLDGFHVNGFVPALLCWVVVSATSWIARAVLDR